MAQDPTGAARSLSSGMDIDGWMGAEVKIGQKDKVLPDRVQAALKEAWEKMQEAQLRVFRLYVIFRACPGCMVTQNPGPFSLCIGHACMASKGSARQAPARALHS